MIFSKFNCSRGGGKILIPILLCSNLIFIVSTVTVLVRSGYAKRIGVKLGLVEYDQKSVPDYWAVDGWTNSLEKLNLKVDVAFFGNSITRMSSFDEYFKDVSICNLGYAGDNLDGMLRRVKMLKAVHPEKIFVMGGINGLKDISEQDFRLKYEHLLSDIRDSLPDAEIFVQSMLPVNHTVYHLYGDNQRISSFNGIIKDIASRKSVRYIDLYSLYLRNGELPSELTMDGIHLYPHSYQLWAQEISPFLKE